MLLMQHPIVATVGLVLVKVPTVHPGAAGVTPEQSSMRRGRNLAGLGAGIALARSIPRVTARSSAATDRPISTPAAP